MHDHMFSRGVDWKRKTEQQGECVYKRENSNEMDWRKETMNEEREREEIDPVSNVYTLEHSGECAELRLMVDIKTQKRGRIDAICKSPGRGWF